MFSTLTFFKRCVTRFFHIQTVYETQFRMCMHKEKFPISKATHLHEVLSLRYCVTLVAHGPLRPGGTAAQHSNSSMTSMTIVRGPVRIRLLTVR